MSIYLHLQVSVLILDFPERMKGGQVRPVKCQQSRSRRKRKSIRPLKDSPSGYDELDGLLMAFEESGEESAEEKGARADEEDATRRVRRRIDDETTSRKRKHAMGVATRKVRPRRGESPARLSYTLSCI